ncbi:MAG: hypothetical protein KGL95_08840, partial [Patescibacteria group bacterium]|nr:hypothetical protein [Patescibacteria group bacterium]
FRNPLIPSGQYKGPNFSNLQPGTYYNYNGTRYLLTTSVKGAPGSGVLYGINPQGQTVALYGPPSAYQPVTPPNITQPGGFNGHTQVPSTRVG